jgi:PEP-CTERM motif
LSNLVIKLLRATVFVCAAVVVCANEARADSMTIGPTCATCQGSTYTLDILGLAPLDLYAADGTNDTYRVALTINTDDYSGTGVRIDEVAVKIAASVDKTSLVSAPGDVSYWALVPGGLNADGCSGKGSGFVCSDWIVGSAGGAVLANASSFTWVFDIDISSPLFGFTITNPDLPSIKARYVDDAGNKVGALVSETVPEPGTLALLGIGASLAAIRRRRAQR